MLKTLDRKKIIILIVISLAILGLIEFYQCNKDWEKLLITIKNYEQMYPDKHLKYAKKDTYNVFMDFMMNSRLNMLQIIFPLIVIIPGIINLHNLLKSGIYKDIIIRSNYKKVISKEILKCYIPVIIIPLFLVFMFILSYIYSGSFDIQFTYENMLGKTMNFPYRYMDIPFLFIAVYILNIGLIGIFFINISLLLINKNKSFLLTVLLSFLTIMAYQISSEVIVGSILANIFDNYIFRNIFSIYNLWVYDGVSLTSVTLYVISIVIISTMLVYHTFKNKEWVVIENEK